jgi:hypothetical protein
MACAVARHLCRSSCWHSAVYGSPPASFPPGTITPRNGVWRSLVSALVWGTRGPRFESGHPDCDTDAKAAETRRNAFGRELQPFAEAPDGVGLRDVLGEVLVGELGDRGGDGGDDLAYKLVNADYTTPQTQEGASLTFTPGAEAARAPAYLTSPERLGAPEQPSGPASTSTRSHRSHSSISSSTEHRSKAASTARSSKSRSTAARSG